MLKSWSINNFKSFQGTTELHLRSLTLLCGANSSGKSSVLQSILLIKQTVQYAPPSRAIALNGALVRLGVFSDIENFNSRKGGAEHSIGFGWCITSSQDKSIEKTFNPLMEEIKSVTVNFSFDIKGDARSQNNLELQPILKETKLAAEISHQDGESNTVYLSLARSTGVGRKLLYNSTTFLEAENFSDYKISNIDDDTTNRAKEGFPSASIVGCTISHFLPSEIVVRYDRGKFISRQLATRLTGIRNVRRSLGFNVNVPPEVLDLVREAIVADTNTLLRNQSILSAIVELDETGSITAFDLGSRLQSLPLIVRRTITERLAKSQTAIETSFYKVIGREPTITGAGVESLRSANSLNSDFFRFAVRYLGPLRDEPRPSYPLQALSSPTDVGPKGELTAAVLHLNEKRSLTYIPARCFTDDAVSVKPQTATLKVATIDWLSYLGVAVDVETNEKGKFGHELRVKGIAEDDFQDLTNVGVGVSQVLPIIVTCLLAPVGAVIILEQPELHLHPKVQARLADFFISMTKLRKQCIIETHGEHLIERLRYRIVCDDSDEILGDTQIYFFNRIEGATQCQQVKLNTYGAISNWPVDFFDQSQKEAQRIVMKALHKKGTTSKRLNESGI